MTHLRIPLGHRGLSHSLLFAAAVATIIVPLFFGRTREAASRARGWLYVFLATASHGALDAHRRSPPASR